MNEIDKNLDGAFKNHAEYASIMNGRAGAITAFRAGDHYDFYGDDVEVIVGVLPDLADKVSSRKLSDGSTVDTISVSREKIYDSLESLLDYNEGMLGFVFLDKPDGIAKTDDVSITAAYDKWCRLNQQNGGINILIRHENFETYGTDAKKVDKRIGTDVEDGEKVYLPATVVRHNIMDITKLYGTPDAINTFDYSSYLRENVIREMKLTAQASRQNGIGGKKVATDTKKATDSKTGQETESVSRQKAVYEQQAEMLSAALSNVAENGGYWLNQNHKNYPQIYYDAESEPLTPYPYQALMMCLHSDALDSTLNDYTTFIASKRIGSPIIAGERGVPLLISTNLRYVNQENQREIGREDYQKLQPDERGKYKGISSTELRTLFNVEQTVNISLANKIYQKSHGKPAVHSYDKYTEEERSDLMIRFNDFLLKMKDNLVDIKFSEKASSYFSISDVVNLTDWKEAKDNIRNGENDYPYYMQHAIRQIVEATGNERRLNRAGSLQRNGELSKEDVEKNGELIVEIASAIKMMEFGLPAELTPWSRLKDIDYWKAELKEKPQILETIEREVNRSLRMIRKAELGEKIKLNENVGLKKEDSTSYRIASQLREHPSLKDEETPNIIYVIDRKGKTADVIVPDDVDLAETNKVVEFDHFRKEANNFLSDQGIEEIKYYKPSGENYYGPNDNSFKGKEIHAVSFGDGKVIDDNILDAPSLKARAMDRHLNRVDMLQDVNGNWTFMIDSQYNFDVEELEDPIYVHPDKRDLRRYFSTMKNFPDDIQELRLELARKYQSAVMKDPNLKINPFEVKDEALDVSCIQKAYIYKNKEGDIMCKPQIEGVDNIEERKMSVGQWKLLWLSDDMEKTKRNIAAVLYADTLKQEIEKEETQEVKEVKQEAMVQTHEVKKELQEAKEQTQEVKEVKQEVKEDRQVTEDVDDKVFESIIFEGREYPCRVVKDAENNSLLIAPTQLMDRLKPYPTDYDEHGGFVSEEAQAVDKRIFYYTDKDSLQNHNNEELVAMLRKENPEISEKKEETEDLAEKESYPMLKSYNQLKEEHPDCLLLFRMGDFYEAYQDDAKTVSELLDITLTRRNEKNGEVVQMTGFPYRVLDTYLPKLIRAGQRVAICDPKPIEKITPSKTINKQENVETQKATEEEVKPDKDYIVKARYKLDENVGDWHEEAFKDIKATAERLHNDLDLGFDKLDATDIRVHKSPVPDAYNADLFLCKSGVDVALVSLHFGFATIKENEDSHVELSNGDIRIKLYGEGNTKSEPISFEHNIPYDELLNMVRGKIKELCSELSRAGETGRADGLDVKETVEEEETESRQHSMRR